MVLPTQISDERWEAFILTDSRKRRIKYLEFLAVVEDTKRLTAQRKRDKLLMADEINKEKQLKQQELEERAARGEMVYNVRYNTLFTRYHDDSKYEKSVPNCIYCTCTGF